MASRRTEAPASSSCKPQMAEEKAAADVATNDSAKERRKQRPLAPKRGRTPRRRTAATDTQSRAPTSASRGAEMQTGACQTAPHALMVAPTAVSGAGRSTNLSRAPCTRTGFHPEARERREKAKEKEKGRKPESLMIAPRMTGLRPQARNAGQTKYACMAVIQVRMSSRPLLMCRLPKFTATNDWAFLCLACRAPAW